MNRIAYTGLLLLVVPTSTFAAVPFRVKEPSGINRKNALVTVSIPVARGEFPAAQVGQTTGLCLESDVATQARVLETWHDGSPRWVMVKFLADFEANQERTFKIARGTKGADRAVALDTDEAVAINTGRLHFHVKKGSAFTLLQEVQFDGAIVTKSLDHAGIVCRDHAGKVYYGKADTVVLQENGSVQAVVRAEGRFLAKDGSYLKPRATKDGDGLEVKWSCWIYATADSSDIRIVFNLHNPGSKDCQAHEGSNPTVDGVKFSGTDNLKQWLFITDLRLEIPTTLGAGEFLSETGAHAGSSAQLFQTFIPGPRGASPDSQFKLTYSVDGAKKSPEQAPRSEGWLTAKAGAIRITPAFQYFWQEWPKSISLEKGRVVFGVFPKLSGNMVPTWHYDGVKTAWTHKSWSDGSQSNEPENWDIPNKNSYYIQGGRWKAYSMLLSMDKAEASHIERVKAFKAPLMGVVDSDYLYTTKALIEFSPKTLDAYADPIIREAAKRRQRWRTSMVDMDLAYGRGKRTIASSAERDAQGKAWVNVYGYPNWGCLGWGGGARYSNLHYDWSFGMLNDFLRYGDYRFWENGERMARHKREWDQYHHLGGLCWADGLSWYEKSDHTWEPDRPRLTHNWNGGMLLHYLLTGDELSRRAVIENAQGVYASWFWEYRLGGDLKKKAVRTGMREQGWSILAMMHGYELTHDKKYLDQSMRVFRQVMIHTISSVGGMRTYIDKHGILMLGYCGPGLIKLCNNLPADGKDKKDVTDFIESFIKTIQEQGIRVAALGSLEHGKQFIPGTYRDPWGKPNVGYTIFFTDQIAYLLSQGRVPDMRKQLTDHLYVGFVHQASRNPTTVGDEETYPATAYNTATGGQTTKELGWYGLFGSYALGQNYKPAAVPEL